MFADCGGNMGILQLLVELFTVGDIAQGLKGVSNDLAVGPVLFEDLDERWNANGSNFLAILAGK